MASSDTFAKRQKDRARVEKRRAKEAKRKQRRAEGAANRAAVEPGVDPDIAGIVPGPQPPADDS